jgi:hypothetical protein
LPKWTGFIVIGNPITKKQAKEVLIRTDHSLPEVITNCSEYEKEINNIFNLTSRNVWRRSGKSIGVIEFMDEYKKRVIFLKDKLDIVFLSHMYNSRIASSHIDGPHGWCDWNGNIFTNKYNIGKYPCALNVLMDWATIAKEFPFLQLRCQLLNGEIQDDNVRPIVEYIVHNGTVKVDNPKSNIPIFPPANSSLKWELPFFKNRFSNSKHMIEWEIGISIHDLKETLIELYDEIPQSY